MPRQIVTLMRASPPVARDAPTSTAVFRVDPKMTKHEIKEYLGKIYDLPVKKVNTANYDGKLKRGSFRVPGAVYKRKAFKKAYVTFEGNVYTDRFYVDASA